MKDSGMKSIEIIMIPVADQNKAKEFYLKLGFSLLLEAPSHHGQTWMQVGFPGKEGSLSLANFHGVIIQTDNIEGEMAELKSKGIQVEDANDTPWGRFAWMKDPDGNSICLHQK